MDENDQDYQNCSGKVEFVVVLHTEYLKSIHEDYCTKIRIFYRRTKYVNRQIHQTFKETKHQLQGEQIVDKTEHFVVSYHVSLIK